MEALQFGQFSLSVVLSVIVGVIFKMLGGDAISERLKVGVMVGVGLGLGLLAIPYGGLPFTIVNIVNCLLVGLMSAAAASGFYSWTSKGLARPSVGTKLSIAAYVLLPLLLLGGPQMQGCAGTQGNQSPVQVSVQDPAVQDLAVKLSARQLGYRLGVNNPARVDEFIGYCEAFTGAGADPVKLFGALVVKLDLQSKAYPLLEPDLRDLLQALNINVSVDSVLTERQMQLVFLGVAAFHEGLVFSRGQK